MTVKQLAPKRHNRQPLRFTVTVKAEKVNRLRETGRLWAFIKAPRHPLPGDEIRLSAFAHVGKDNEYVKPCIGVVRASVKREEGAAVLLEVVR